MKAPVAYIVHWDGTRTSLGEIVQPVKLRPCESIEGRPACTCRKGAICAACLEKR